MSKITERNKAISKAKEILSNQVRYIIVDTETSGDELIAICLELKEISAQRLALEKKEKVIQAKCGLYLKEMDKEDVSIGNGQKVIRVHSMVELKSRVPLEDLPDNCKVTRLDISSVKKLLQQGKIDNELFSYEDKWSIKFKKQ